MTQRGVRSLDIFSDEDDRLTYLRLLRKHTELQGVEILAWCLMTNHIHFIAVPQEVSSLARAFGEADRLYTRMKNFGQGVRGYLFQGRFGSCVLDERHLVAAARYVEQNPVRAKMVKEPWDYKWSSARFHVGITGPDFLVTDQTLMGTVSDWRSLLKKTDDELDRKLRAGVPLGRPMGDEAFVQKVGEIVGRNLSKGKPGRPRMAKPELS